MLTVCYAAKGGSGTSVTAAALALTTRGSLLVDLDGDALDVLGIPCGSRPGITDWLASSAEPDALADLVVAAGDRCDVLPAGTRGRRPGGARRSTCSCSSSGWPVTTGRWLSTPVPERRRRFSPSAPTEVLLVTRACYLALRRAARVADLTHRRDPRTRTGASIDHSRRRRHAGHAGRRRDPVRPGDLTGGRRGFARRRPTARTAASHSQAGGVIAGTPDAVTELCALVEPLDGDPRELAGAHVGRVAPLATQHERHALVDAAVARLVGLGPLQPFLDDESVDEVLVNGTGELWIERSGRLEVAGWVAPDELAVVLERVLAPLGRRLDRTNPIVDAAPRRRLTGVRRRPAGRRRRHRDGHPPFPIGRGRPRRIRQRDHPAGRREDRSRRVAT